MASSCQHTTEWETELGHIAMAWQELTRASECSAPPSLSAMMSMFWLSFGIEIHGTLLAVVRACVRAHGAQATWESLLWAGSCLQTAKNKHNKVHSEVGYLSALIERRCKQVQTADQTPKAFDADDFIVC